MKWKFGLETLLKYRSQLTDEAMIDFSEAQAQLDAALRTLDRLYHEVDQNFLDIQKYREQGGLSAESLKTHDEFFAGQQIRIENQKKTVRELKEVAEAKYEVLVNKLVDKKSIEKIKQNRKEIFLKEQKKKEQSEIDDIVVMRGKRRVRA